MMNDLLIYLSIALLFGFIGVYIGRLLSKLKFQKENNSLDNENIRLTEKIDSLNKIKEQNENLIHSFTLEKESFIKTNTNLQSEVNHLNDKLKVQKEEAGKLHEKFAKEFENLATQILDKNSTKFKNQNKESIDAILNPLKEKIEVFEKKVTETQEKSIDMHSALRTQLNQIKDLNAKMSKEANNLTKALKGDSKVQGDWGETQLELLLEKANLTKDVHYSTQGGYRDEEGKLKKPDFIINLPDNRHLIVDSKVSLTAYESYFSADEETEKELYLKRHIDSLRKHFKDLGDKKYDALYEINSPDYVLMFVPIEPALLLALNKAENLYLEALDKNVVLVSTSTLLATLSTVSSMWRQENQKRNVIEIAKQAGALYDQFVNLTNDLIKVGNQLKTVQGSYDSSMKKLTGRGNLVKKVEKIKELGATASKSIDQKLLDRAQNN